jgi:hypothetical protein
MAENSPITADAEWFIGADHQMVFGPVLDGDNVPVDITGWSLSWMLKRRLNDLDALALLTKTPAITGSYNVVAASNTQRAVVTIADTDTDAFVARVDYRHELKRMDAGSEQVLAYGTAVLKRGVHRT